MAAMSFSQKEQGGNSGPMLRKQRPRSDCSKLSFLTMPPLTSAKSTPLFLFYSQYKQTAYEQDYRTYVEYYFDSEQINDVSTYNNCKG